MGVSSPLGSLTSIGLSSFPSGLDTAPDLAERSRPRRPRLAVYNKIGEPVSDLFVGGYSVITALNPLSVPCPTR